ARDCARAPGGRRTAGHDLGTPYNTLRDSIEVVRTNEAMTVEQGERALGAKTAKIHDWRAAVRAPNGLGGRVCGAQLRKVIERLGDARSVRLINVVTANHHCRRRRVEPLGDDTRRGDGHRFGLTVILSNRLSQD